MITEYKIRKLAYLDTQSLEAAVQKNHPEDRFIQSKFLGITNGGQFCYQIGYQDPDLNGQGLTYCKVFVDLDTHEEPVADFYPWTIRPRPAPLLDG